MTVNVFITGDRSLDPVTAVQVVAGVLDFLNASPEDLEIYTGSFPSGVERAVRYLVPDAYEIVHSDDDNGHAMLDARHEHLAGMTDLAVLIHPDPLASRVGASVVKYFSGDRLLLI